MCASYFFTLKVVSSKELKLMMALWLNATKKPRWSKLGVDSWGWNVSSPTHLRFCG